MIDLRKLSVEKRVSWALENLNEEFVLTSSFGAQAAVCLHLLTRQHANIPIVLVDTGYLFPETYQFIDQLTEQLKLNLKVYKSDLSPSWLESRYGSLWEKDLAGINQFNQLMKVEPLQRAFKELKVKTWFSGLRNQQSQSRKNTPLVEQKGAITKFHPIIDFSDKDVFDYLKKHSLPYHPLWEQGYVSIGDIHTTKPLSQVSDSELTRFHGLKRECGIHELSF